MLDYKRTVPSLLIALAAPALSWAQDLNPDISRPTSPGDGEMSAVKSARQTSAGEAAAGVYFGWSNDSLVAVDDSGERLGSAIHNRYQAILGASYGLGRFELSLQLPVILDQESAQMPTGTALGGSGLADATLGGRTRLIQLGQSGPTLSASVEVGVPTAVGADMAGTGSLALYPTLISDWHAGKLRFAANVGGALRPSRQIGDLEIGNALTLGAGTALALFGPETVALTAEVLSEVGGGGAAEIPIEARSGLRWRFSRRWMASVNYGRGVQHGYGAPDHRGLAGVTFVTAAPERPQAASGPIEIASRPPNPDIDQDGIANTFDSCPEDAEDRDGFEDDDGCPESDNDGDGVLDDTDRCPVHGEDSDDFEPDDGCPEPDNDFDGILDTQDACLDEPEVINGVEDDDGCPDEGRVLVVVGRERIEIREQVYFAHNQDEILPESEPLIDQLTKTIKRRPWLKKIQIGGHTDERGDDAYNLDLSRRRAAAVRAALIANGVEEGRLEAVGFGETQPIDTNATLSGRANNRRVEFLILEQEEPSRSVKPAPAKNPGGDR